MKRAEGETDGGESTTCDCSTFLKLLSNKCLYPRGWASKARHGITLVTFRIRLEKTTAPMRLRTPSQLVVRSLTRRRKICERTTAQSSALHVQLDSHAFIITKCDALVSFGKSPTRWKTVADLHRSKGWWISMDFGFLSKKHSIRRIMSSLLSYFGTHKAANSLFDVDRVRL